MTSQLLRHAAGQRSFVLPDGATDVYLVRHGATVWPGADGVLPDLPEGPPEPWLSPLGEEQARQVADRLAGAGISRVFTTGVVRTHQTALPLAERLGIEPVAIRALREVDLGDWNSWDGLARLTSEDPVALEVFRQQRWDVIPNAEPADAFAERVRGGVVELVEHARRQTVAAVLHAGTIAEICRQTTGSRRFAFVHVMNGSVSRLIVLADGQWVLQSFNDTSHLAVQTVEPVR